MMLRSFLSCHKTFLDNPLKLKIFLWAAGCLSGFLFFWNISAFALWAKSHGFSYRVLAWISFLQWPYVLKPLYLKWLRPSARDVAFHIGLCLLACGLSSCFLASTWIHHDSIGVFGVMFLFCMASAYIDLCFDLLKLHAYQKHRDSSFFSCNSFGFQVGLWLTGWVVWRLVEPWGWDNLFKGLALILLLAMVFLRRISFDCGISWSQPHSFWPKSTQKTGWVVLCCLCVYKCFDVGMQGLSDFLWMDRGYTLTQIADTAKGCGALVSMLTTSVLALIHRPNAFFLTFVWVYLIGSAGLFGIWTLQAHQEPTMLFLYVNMGCKSALVSLGVFLSQWLLANASGQNQGFYVMGTTMQTLFRLLHSFCLMQFTHFFSWKMLYGMLFFLAIFCCIKRHAISKCAQEDLNPQPLDP